MSVGHMMETTPEWSGLWLENDEVGYLEVSDLDDRFFHAPPGWTLITVDECPEHSSQIFRYVRVDAAGSSRHYSQVVGLLVAVCATGASVLGLPVIQAILHNQGVA